MTSQRHRTAATRAGCIRGAAAVVSMGSLLSFASLTSFAPLALASCGGAQPSAQTSDARSLAEYDLARDSFQRGRLREALAHVEEALSHDEDNAEASYLGALILLGFCAGDAHSSDCRFDSAEKMARRALEANPEMRDAKNALGVILVHQRRYDEAIAVLKPLTEDILYASPEKSWGNLGWAYLLKGRNDEAIDALRRAVAAQPLFCVGQYRLGLAYEKRGELDLAREALTKAVETDQPECTRLQDAFDARARIAEKRGLVDDARADLERCREIDATTPVGQRCAAQLQTLQ
ncbi:tetratricopeptide repeat protein [Sorangium atrum]|uniref:Tetratricopeptide repeat protein n=1 Tax=Sorangium atrum TaxID=2995308 RepID=A0ABT5CBQ5_9BACT|nr:tetratricopeptide repeat protein [Sorangium aterium]MDC0683219.1 tetratricopeptide repeat protein [Sorangium aterium]